jgi:DNA repair protein RecO (recombination protein O)
VSRYLDTRAVVLGSRPLGEADRILVLFTREAGRVDAVVKGVRKTKSRWGGRLEPFNVCDLVLFRGRSLATVTSADLVAGFSRLRASRAALTAAAVTCEAASRLFGEEEPHERVFNLLCRALRAFDDGFAGDAASAPVLLGSLVKLLHEAGFLPVLDHCVCCGEGHEAVAFSASRGGLVCGECVGEGVPIAPDAVEVLCDAVAVPLDELRARPPSPAVGEALRHLHALFMYQTGARLRSLRCASG